MTIRQSRHDAPCGVRKQATSSGPDRRRFLVATTGAVTSLAVPEAARAAALPSAGTTASDFRKALNTPFRVTALSHPSLPAVTLMLADVTAAGHAHPSLDETHAGELAFSLKFVRDARRGADPLPQDTYLLSHPTLGEFAALMVPTGDGSGLRAEINRY